MAIDVFLIAPEQYAWDAILAIQVVHWIQAAKQTTEFLDRVGHNVISEARQCQEIGFDHRMSVDEGQDQNSIQGLVVPQAVIARAGGWAVAEVLLTSGAGHMVGQDLALLVDGGHHPGLLPGRQVQLVALRQGGQLHHAVPEEVRVPGLLPQVAAFHAMVQHQPLQVLLGQVQHFRGQFREECGSTHQQTCSQSRSIGLRTAPSAFVRFPLKGPFGLQERFLRRIGHRHVPRGLGALMRPRHPIGEGVEALLDRFPPESMVPMLHLKEGGFNIRAVGQQARRLDLLQ
mmetsp:Transcript_9103/g.14771  ORF Transcript_9103/g.14771 Transcript_9103/m.14771 type:complete len:287 (-) Transcript_9103:311-1171(-)